MCRGLMSPGGFDPSLCPLLQNLPPEEQQERMRNDPAISRCVRAMGGVARSAPVAPPRSTFAARTSRATRNPRRRRPVECRARCATAAT